MKRPFRADFTTGKAGKRHGGKDVEREQEVTGRDRDSGLACLVIIARLYGLPADSSQLRHQFGHADRPVDTTDLLRAARSLGLKAKAVRSGWERLSSTPLPAIARDKDGQFFLVAQVKDDQVLIQDPGEPQPTTLDQADLESRWDGGLILLTRRAGQAGGARKFDFSWFIPAILKYKRLLLDVFIASFCLQLFALVTPLFFQVVIDKVLVHHGLTTLDVLAIGLLVVSAFDVILGGLRTYVFSHTTSRMDVTLGADLFRHLLRLPLSYFEARRVGDTVARVRELDSIRRFITGSALTLVIDLLFTVVFFAVMYLYSPLLTFIVLGTIPLYALLAFLVTPVLRARLHEKFNRGAENQAFLVESVSGVQTLKAAAVEPQSQRRWEEQLAGYVRSSFKAANLGNIANQGASFINKITVLLILWLGARLVIGGDLSVGQLVAFNMLAARISSPILRLVQLWQDFQQAGISVQRLGDILNAKPEPTYRPGRASLPDLAGRVTFEHVTFRYRPDGPEVLRDVSLHVPAGKVIGIVGRSGSGKSTLTKLIQRLYVPQSGRVLVDGVDLAMVDTVWLRRHIGVVLQENFLFNRSIRENIALSDPALPMERVVQAAKLAGAHDFILELPEGYDTVVEEHGSNLSGGQRQRLAIARALITNPRILILDEATSALDYESEHIIHQNMRYICKGRTVFIIAHRLSAVRHADHIIVIDKGQIIEGGTHSELMAHNGYYTRLYQHQLGLLAVN
jgi:subfamily B ATP-binding cassette protein HlyB/CyaB